MRNKNGRRFKNDQQILNNQTLKYVILGSISLIIAERFAGNLSPHDVTTVTPFLALVAAFFAIIATAIATNQSRIGLAALIEAKRQTYILRFGSRMALPSDEELLYESRLEDEADVMSLCYYIKLFWWKPPLPHNFAIGGKIRRYRRRGRLKRL